MSLMMDDHDIRLLLWRGVVYLTMAGVLVFCAWIAMRSF